MPRQKAVASRDSHPSAMLRVGESGSAEQPPRLPVPMTAAPEARAWAARPVPRLGILLMLL